MFHSFLPFENFTLTLGAVHLKCEDGMNVALNVFFFSKLFASKFSVVGELHRTAFVLSVIRMIVFCI